MSLADTLTLIAFVCDPAPLRDPEEERAAEEAAAARDRRITGQVVLDYDDILYIDITNA